MPRNFAQKSLIILLFVVASTVNGAEKTKPLNSTEVFADDFSSNEFNKQWKHYKSVSKIQDGVLIGREQQGGGHAAVENVMTKPYGDVEVVLDFKMEGSPGFNLTFNQHKYKETHAGHICRAVIRTNGITLRDGATGNFKNSIYKKVKAKQLDAKTKALLKTKQKNIPYKFKKGKWYNLLVRIQGDEMTVFLDGKMLGKHRSDGYAHATKDKLGIVTPKSEMHYDNLKILVP